MSEVSDSPRAQTHVEQQDKHAWSIANQAVRIKNQSDWRTLRWDLSEGGQMKSQTPLMKEVLDLMKCTCLESHEYMQNYLPIIVDVKQ